MAAVAAKDPVAERALVTRLGPRVRRVTRLLSRSTADADDAAQLALIEILRSADGFRVGTSLERWAERITARTTLRSSRRERDRKSLLERWLTHDTQPWGGPISQAGGEQAGLDELLECLSPDSRQALVLHHALEYSVEEIAKLTGTRMGTVKDRLVSARKKLRKLLERDARRLQRGGGA